MSEAGKATSVNAAAADTVSVRSVGYTPIKGTRHMVHSAPEFDEFGPVGDRRFCLIDVDRRQVLKTVQNPRLLSVIARLNGAELETTLPDGRSARAVPEPTGETLTCDYWKRQVDLTLADGPHAALLSSWLGRPVRVAWAARGDVVFGAPISIVATASLRELAGRVDRPGLVDEAARFRATVVIDTDEPFVEETWQGREMTLSAAHLGGSGIAGARVGGSVGGATAGGSQRGGAAVGGSQLGGLRVRIGEPIPRCAVMDLDPITGERNGRLLTTLAAYRPRNESGEPLFGVYAEVVDPTSRPGEGGSDLKPLHRGP